MIRKLKAWFSSKSKNLYLLGSGDLSLHFNLIIDAKALEG